MQFLACTFLLLTQSIDTLVVRDAASPPPPGNPIAASHLGEPSMRIPTGQGLALVWLLRAADTFFVAASIPDSSVSPADAFALSLDTQGDAASTPEHDDFQWDLHRLLDSSQIYRGNNGRWQPPRGDPDWRLGSERSGGGWEVSGWSAKPVWGLLLRLDPAWLEGGKGRLPRIAFRIYDNGTNRNYTLPLPAGTAPASMVERSPQLWLPVRDGRT